MFDLAKPDLIHIQSFSHCLYSAPRNKRGTHEWVGEVHEYQQVEQRHFESAKSPFIYSPVFLPWWMCRHSLPSAWSIPLPWHVAFWLTGGEHLFYTLHIFPELLHSYDQILLSFCGCYLSCLFKWMWLWIYFIVVHYVRYGNWGASQLET